MLCFARIRNRRRIKPAHEPIEIAEHVLALERRLEVDVPAARIDVELHRLVQRFHRFVEFPRLTQRHPIVVFPVLDEQRRRDIAHVRDGRVRNQRGRALPGDAEVLGDEIAPSEK